MTPVVRSFVSIPAGVFEVPFRRYTVLTFLGSAIWCFGLAGVGWALGSRWEDFHHTFRYIDYAIVAWSWEGPRGWPGSTCVGAASPQPSPARLYRP